MNGSHLLAVFTQICNRWEENKSVLLISITVFNICATLRLQSSVNHTVQIRGWYAQMTVDKYHWKHEKVLVAGNNQGLITWGKSILLLGKWTWKFFHDMFVQ